MSVLKRFFFIFLFVSWLISFSWRGDRHRSHGHHRLCGTLRKNRTYRSAPDLSMLLYCHPSSSFRLNSYSVYIYLFFSPRALGCATSILQTHSRTRRRWPALAEGASPAAVADAQHNKHGGCLCGVVVCDQRCGVLGSAPTVQPSARLREIAARVTESCSERIH